MQEQRGDGNIRRSGDAQAAILRGHEARKAGRAEEALEHYRNAVAAAPDSAEANTVFGLMLLHSGQVDEAEAPLRKALAVEPSHISFRMNFAEWLHCRGDLDQAIAIAEAVSADAPRFWWVWDKLGDMSVSAQRFAVAEAHYSAAVERRADDPALLFKWARAAFDAGRLDVATRVLESAARLAPGHEAIGRLCAHILEARHDWPALQRLAADWSTAQPRNAEPWRLLARAQWETGQLQGAMHAYRAALDCEPPSAEHLATFGRLCMLASEYEDAARTLDAAEALDPANAHMLSGQAILAMFRGRNAQAEAYCRRSLAQDPDDAAAFKVLVQLRHGRLATADLEALRRLAARTDILPRDRVTAGFALADCLDAGGDADAAFAIYTQANREASASAAREGFVYDRAARVQQTDELMRLFDHAPPPLAAEPTPPWPVFIVGMPRSGTTLIESVLGAHSRVLACGERAAMRTILQEAVEAVRADPAALQDPERLAHWRAQWWQGLPAAGTVLAVIDKNPWNFDALGLILLLFPGARIVHLRRDPLETGLSIFRNEFPKFATFATRLEDIGHYHGEYARLMAHWERVLAGRFLTVQYEYFVVDFERRALELLRFCGLAWEDACRDFAASTRVISTMSTVQARLPLGTLRGRAARYAAHLGPLLASLDAAGVDRLSGARRAPST